jgi:ankyrin repeat protein
MNVLIKFQTIDWLVNNGASINMCEGSQRTPLHLAVATGRADVVQYLITKGIYKGHPSYQIRYQMHRDSQMLVNLPPQDRPPLL